LEEISDSQTAQTQHWRGFPAGSVVGLLIRRSLVRAQVGEPKKLKEALSNLNIDLGGYPVNFTAGPHGSRFVDVVAIDRTGRVIG